MRPVLEAVPLVAALLLGVRPGTPSRGRATRPPVAAGLDAPASAQADETVRVTVFRHLIEKSQAADLGSNGPYCLAVGTGDAGRPPSLGDPRPGVLQHLQDLGATLRAFSRCRAGDRLFYTAGVQWRRADEARVNAASLGWVGREREGAHVWYTVQLDPDGWRVTAQQVQPD
jgi:hypothetical protein